jgi:pimeloyl-ACP methyl ester carboxylesterase
MTSPRTGYAPVNGINLYYEIHGSGAPLILIHGGFGSTGMFGDLLPALAAHRQVIPVDLQGHGRTGDYDRPLRFEQMGDDIAALIAHLGLGTATVMGYSLGGDTALQTAIRHPEVVDRLVVISSAHKRSAWQPENLAGMDQLTSAQGEQMKQSPMYQAYASVAPRPEEWSGLWGKMGDLLRQEYDWSDSIAAFTMPTMLVFGDADSISPANAAEFFALLGGGQRDGSWDRSGVTRHRLAILPDTTHYDIFASPLLAAAVVPFLDPAPSIAN